MYVYVLSMTRIENGTCISQFVKKMLCFICLKNCKVTVVRCECNGIERVRFPIELFQEEQTLYVVPS